MYWKSAMRKCNSFRCISQLTRETADFDKSHVLSHLQMRRRSIGSKHGFGHSLNPKDPKNFRVTCILWKTWHPSPARLCRPSPLTQGDLKQALTFPLSFANSLATALIFNRIQVPQPKPDKKLLAELRRLPPLSEAEGLHSQETIYSQLIPENEGRGL